MTSSTDKPHASSALRDLGLPLGPPHPCPYIPGRSAREHAFAADGLPPGMYQRLMDHGWRRTGRVFYRPGCPGCAACVPIRIPSRDFRPSRTQRKVLARNRDIQWRLQPAEPTDEAFDLFVRYQRSRHAGDMCTERHQFEEALYESPIASGQITGRLQGRLVACALVDIEPRSISSGYTFFDPGLPSRSLGVLAILTLIEFCRAHDIPHYYLGYYIHGCRKMDYKSQYRPYELGDSEGGWRRYDQRLEDAEEWT